MSKDKEINCFINKKRKVYTTLYTPLILLLTSTFVLFLVSIPFLMAQSELIASTSGNNAPSTDIFNLTSGYTIEPVIWNLTAPDSIAFDDNGNMYVGEAGYPFTNIPEVPRILKIDPNGNVSVFVNTKLNSPIVDITFHEGLLYVSHRDKISTVNIANGTVKDIIVGLNQNGDHPNNQIVFSQDGKRLFFGTGSATNSGVVGEDNVLQHPGVPDVPGQHIILTGQNFVSKNPLTAEPNDNATTGAFVPFNTTTKEGQIIPGDIKCTGCILSANLDGTDLKMEGWGFRNPTGLGFNEGRLFTVSHGADERGSRPIANDNDKFYEVKLNETAAAFYGWPDFFGNAEPVTDPKFQSHQAAGGKPLEFVMQDHPPVEKPLLLFEPPHTAVIQMAFANKSFGFEGEAFVAQIGSHLPPPGETVGQNVVRVNIDNKTVSDFLTLNNPTTIFRPTDVAFSQNGTDTLYIVDWGNLREPGPGDTIPKSGIVWKITPTT